ncbi:MAG TPA: efflux RND transporter periplasmic adaptor subunit [Methyloceanibacter sp.]|nr:efflux RND transporter periplasmic adaptor subunit [Methyloceanibacter sp.]
MRRMRIVVGYKVSGIALLVPLLLSACDSGKPTSDADKPLPSVVVEAVTAKDVSDQVDFVGRTEASQRVDVRARVSGTLLKRPFEEGAEVKEGAVLFEIDPAEFDADLLSAEAKLAKAQASLEENDRSLARYEVLLKREAASEAQYDIAKSKADQSRADVSAAQADVERAKLDLSYATITSPIAGRSGISDVDVGNIIGPDSGVLVTVLDLDPIYVLFSVGERQYLNFMEASKAGTAEKFTPQIRLANDKLYESPGKVEVVDNKVDPATGTINVRLTFPNPNHLLVPGQYVSVLLTGATPERRIVIPQVAVQENQAGSFVLIVDSEGRVEARPVKMGERVGVGVIVLDGLTEGETLVVEGIQKVRPGAEVQTAYRTQAEEPDVVAPQPAPQTEFEDQSLDEPQTEPASDPQVEP